MTYYLHLVDICCCYGRYLTHVTCISVGMCSIASMLCTIGVLFANSNDQLCVDLSN